QPHRRAREERDRDPVEGRGRHRGGGVAPRDLAGALSKPGGTRAPAVRRAVHRRQNGGRLRSPVFVAVMPATAPLSVQSASTASAAITVVIPAFNEQDCLAATLRALQAQ